MSTKNADIISNNKVFGWIAAATAVILFLPFFAMQFTNQVDWNLADFIVMGVLLFGAGSLFVVAARMAPKKYQLVIGAAILLAVLWLWAELAVGVFTNWGS